MGVNQTRSLDLELLLFFFSFFFFREEYSHSGRCNDSIIMIIITKHFYDAPFPQEEEQKRERGNLKKKRRLKALRLQFPIQYPVVTYDLLQNLLNAYTTWNSAEIFRKKKVFPGLN